MHIFLGTEWKKLQSLLAQLRKASNHPYLFPDAETDPGEEPTDEIVTASGKMVILDRLLVKLKEKGHRVVIFSQYTRTLDILDDYLNWRGYTHCRLDGQTNRVWREVLITEFNKPGNDTFVFCLSTRAGGEGVNLYTADTVILFDSDWNPQVDIQAMARVHRIGQTRPVHIYRLVSAGSVEERIVQRAQKKLFLDTMVNRGSSAMGLSMDAVVKEEGGGDTDDIDVSTAISALKFGWNSVFGVTESSGTQSDITYEDLEAIIDRKRGSGHIESLSKVMNEEKKGSSRNDNSSLLLEGQECDIKNFQEKTEFTSLRNFEGNIFENKTSSRRSDYYKAIDEEAVFQEGLKRARVSRLTEEYVSGVGMTAILKSNQYSLTQGEPSVFERETTSQRMKDVAAGLIQKSKRLKAGEDFMNQDHCQLCWEYGDLICCDHCPASYHVACLGLTAEDIPSMWSCPHHKACVDCGKNSKAAGFLFRCAMCPNAHCEDCMGNDQEILGNHPIWHEQGFKATGNCCYVNCSKECTEFFKAQNINKIK
jgi:SWI/SNF-related matrix-associated actin-dependent regulator of chromatin subfamily A member 5